MGIGNEWLWGINVESIVVQYLKYYLKIVKVVLVVVREYHNVVNVYIDKISVLKEQLVHILLYKGRWILKSYKDNVRSLKSLGTDDNYVIVMGLVD